MSALWYLLLVALLFALLFAYVGACAALGARADAREAP
jgi:hypothetical protein